MVDVRQIVEVLKSFDPHCGTYGAITFPDGQKLFYDILTVNYDNLVRQTVQYLTIINNRDSL